MATFDEFITSIRTEFGEQVAGKKFEVFCKWFLQNDPEWSKIVDQVWLWDDYPNKWQRQDLGTDLVFRDNEGLIWAVQVKCYGQHRTATKGDMNSFLADSGRQEVDRRLWMQTTNKMEAKADKTLKGQDKPVTVFTLNNFRDAQIEYPSSFSDLHQAKVKDKPTPDTHQIKAIADAAAGLRTNDRGQMIMACGTGKTFTTLWIKEAVEAHTTLVLLPSLSLLSQTMREWAWAGNTDFDILNVCSDKSVGKKTEDMDSSDAPFPVTSEVEKITEFLKQPKPKVVFCTYQSSDLIAQAQLDQTVPIFDLAVADEAHRCAGKADAGFATILDGEKIRASKRLFTTATPRYFGKTIKDAAKANDLAVVGMDDEAVFGPVIHKLTFGQAIEQELLTDYQVVIVGVDEPMVLEWIRNYEIVSTDPENHTDARTLAAKIGILKAVKDYDLRRIISFHSRVAGAKQFSDELVEVANLIEPANRPKGTFLSDYVSGKMNAGDRKDKIDRLKTLESCDRGILTNARCLAEGVDVPSLDGIAFIDPRGSQVEIIQAVGRAIRKVRGAKVQKKGTIVLPVFIEDGDDHETCIEASNFKPVWDVLKALRAHDEVLADILDQYRTNMAKNASQSREIINDKIIFDLPVSVDAEFSSVLRTVLVEANTASWEFWFGLLEQFKEREGHCRVKQLYNLNGFHLGAWVANQRKTQQILPPGRRHRLDEIGFVWDPLAEAWEEGFDNFVEFKNAQGHCRVPDKFQLNGYNLGNWVGVQRRRQNRMSPERKQKLNEIGFIWDQLSDEWEEGFGNLVAFSETEGHCIVPKSLKLNGYNLGNWVGVQRRRQNRMSPERKQKLNEIGFVWNTRVAAWEEGFNKLIEFEEAEGHCIVSSNFKLGRYNLGTWVRNQRRKRDSLPINQRQKLDSLGFVWNTFDEAWEEGFSNLVEFKNAHGHCGVSHKFKLKSYNLGTWVSFQRQQYESMSPERIKRLDEIGFVWDPLAEAWQKGLSNLIEFKNAQGHFRVPDKFQLNGYNLGTWVAFQRQQYKNLSPERIKKLDDIGFVWDVEIEAWEEGFIKLQQFKEAEGHCKVPQGYKLDGFNLGGWVNNQRAKNKRSMRDEQKQRLDAIGFVWDTLVEAWEEGFSKLLQFKEINGHCKVSDRFKLDDYKLGKWVARQRIFRDSMSPERRQRLDDIGFIWDILTEQWEENFSQLLQFRKSEGHCKVPAGFKLDEFSLGRWVSRQRATKDTMLPERKQRLEDIGFIWGASKNKP